MRKPIKTKREAGVLGGENLNSLDSVDGPFGNAGIRVGNIGYLSMKTTLTVGALSPDTLLGKGFAPTHLIFPKVTFISTFGCDALRSRCVSKAITVIPGTSRVVLIDFLISAHTVLSYSHIFQHLAMLFPLEFCVWITLKLTLK